MFINKDSKYISLQEATKYCHHSQEYLSLRARQGKLKSIKLGKGWATTREWLGEYLKGVNEFNNKRKIKKLGKEISQPRSAFVMAAIFVLLITSIAFGKDGIIQTFKDLNPYLEKISYKNFSQNISDKISQASLAIVSPPKPEIPDGIFERAIDSLSLKIINLSRSKFPEGTFGETINTFKEYGKWLSGGIKNKSRTVAVAIGNLAWKISDSLESAYHFVTKLPEKIRPKKIVIEKEAVEEVPISIQEAIEDLKEEIQGIKEKGVVVREITKEVKVTEITKVEPVKEITKETIKVSDEALKETKEELRGEFQKEISVLRENIQRELAQRPAPVSTAVVYQSPPMNKLYQENNQVILETAGSGNIIISAASDVNISGRQINFNATSATSSSTPVIITSTTAPQLSVRYDATNKLDTSVSSSGEVTFTASGSMVETFPITGSYTLKRGTEAILAVDLNGAIALTARGTDQNITLTPSGTGVISLVGNITLPSTKWIGLGSSAGRILFTDATPDTLTINDAHLLFSADNTYDIGASGATRPRTGYFGTSVVIGSTGTLTTNSLTFSGAGDITAGAISTWQVTGANLTIQTTTSGDLALTSAGSLTETFAASGGYTLKRGTEAILAVDTNGAINITSRGTNQNITLTPSGTGSVVIMGSLSSQGPPTLPHTFSSWSPGVANSNVSNATVYINPATAVADSNLLGLAVNGSVKLLVDAEGDVFVNSLTAAGSVNVGATTISTLTVENNTTLGDASTDWIITNARFKSSLTPFTDNTYDLGENTTPLRWKTGYFGTSVATGNLIFDLTNDVTIQATNPSAIRTYTIPDFGSNDTFVGLAATQTLANKTLTTPIIASLYQTSGGGLLSIPASVGADTFVLLAASQALINKTYNGLTLTSATDGFTIAGGTTPRTLTITGSNVAINQNLQTSNSPTFVGLTLSGLTPDGVVKTASGVLSSEAQLAIAQGGTAGTTTPTAGAIAYGTGTAYAFSAAGSANQLLISGGTGSPTWSNIASLLTQGTNISLSGTTNVTIATSATPSFTTVNGLTITSTAGTLTIANNASAALVTSGNYSITLTATAATNATLPAGTKTLVATDVATLSSLASVGTITTGIWSATQIAVTKGGTGLTTIAAGSILAANSADVLSAVTFTSGLKVLQNSDGTVSWASTTGTGNAVFDTSPTLVTPVFTTSISTPSIITASGALGITPAAGSNLNVSLSTTGDFAVNASQLYVDTSAGNVGIGTTGPSSKLQVSGGGSYFGALAAPTIGTVTCITTGGTLAVGTYYYKVSYLDANGLESIASSEASGTVASGTTGSCTINWTNVTGYTSYKIYGRSTGAQNQYWTDTASPYVDTGTTGTTGYPSLGTSLVTSGNVGIGTTGPDRLLDVLDASNAQLRLTQADNSVYNEFQSKATTGDLEVTTAGTGKNMVLLDNTLKVCESGGCPAITGISGTGDLVVENEAYFSGSKIIYPGDTGWTRPKRSIILTASGAIPPTTSGAAQTKVDGTNTYYALEYDASSDEAAYWEWTMPDSYDDGTIDITYYWTAASITNNVVWCFEARGASAAEAVDAALSTAVCETGTAPGTTMYLVSTTESTAASNFTKGEYITFKVFRDADNDLDTMTGDARLLKVKIEYSVSQESD